MSSRQSGFRWPHDIDLSPSYMSLQSQWCGDNSFVQPKKHDTETLQRFDTHTQKPWHWLVWNRIQYPWISCVIIIFPFLDCYFGGYTRIPDTPKNHTVGYIYIYPMIIPWLSHDYHNYSYIIMVIYIYTLICPMITWTPQNPHQSWATIGLRGRGYGLPGTNPHGGAVRIEVTGKPQEIAGSLRFHDSDGHSHWDGFFKRFVGNFLGFHTRKHGIYHKPPLNPRHFQRDGLFLIIWFTTVHSAFCMDEAYPPVKHELGNSP